MFGKKIKRDLVISSVDLEEALKHLNSLPYTVTKAMPEKWGTQQVKDWLLESLPDKVDIGDSFEFGTGLWAHVKPLGYEFADYDNQAHRLQVVLSIRSVKTDLNQLEELADN